MWDAAADRDRAGVNIAVINVPAVRVFGVAAAGEGRHTLLKRGPKGESNRPTGWAWNRSGSLRIVHAEKSAVGLGT